MKNLLAIAVLFWGATALRADSFVFSYSGGSLTVSGNLTATPDGSNIFTVNSVTGTSNGTTINDISGDNGSFYYAGDLSTGSFDFLVNGQTDWVVFFPDGFYIADGNGNKLYTGTNFTISAVPESATLSLLLSMGLGVVVLARKLPGKARLAS